VVQYPLDQGPGFSSIIDVLKMTMYTFPEKGGKPSKNPIPENEKAKAEKLHQELVEAVAVNDETLMEHYLEKGELDEDEMRVGLKKSLINHDLFPLFCLSGEKDMGSGRLMGFIDNVCPSANEMPPQTTRQGYTLPCDASGQACIFVFKTISEPHVGELSFFKVYSGTVKSGMELVNETTSTSEKIHQLFVVEGNKRLPVTELVAGDIGATLKLKNTHVNNTLHVKGKNVELNPIVFPAPNMTVSIEPVNKGEEEKLARDVYIKMFELWGATIFSNISVSEQRHMDAVLNLLVKYGIPDPVAGKGVGEFTDAFKGLYDELVFQGQQSLLDAYMVGRAIEEMDIDDLEVAMTETSKADIDNVYGNLLNGSFNHLDAFNAHIPSLTQY